MNNDQNFGARRNKEHPTGPHNTLLNSQIFVKFFKKIYKIYTSVVRFAYNQHVGTPIARHFNQISR